MKSPDLWIKVAIWVVSLAVVAATAHASIGTAQRDIEVIARMVGEHGYRIHEGELSDQRLITNQLNIKEDLGRIEAKLDELLRRQ